MFWFCPHQNSDPQHISTSACNMLLNLTNAWQKSLDEKLCACWLQKRPYGKYTYKVWSLKKCLSITNDLFPFFFFSFFFLLFSILLLYQGHWKMVVAISILLNPKRDISFPIIIRKEIETRKLERKSKQKISRLIDLLYRLNDIISR